MLGIPFLGSFVEKTIKKQTVADFCDHLNHYVTAYLLGFFAIAISAKQYFGSPIQCWVPSEFRGGWEKYAEDYCFIANSYHVPFEEEIPKYGDHGREDHLSYYRWVPIMLALQSVMFFLPNYIWNILHKKTAINPRAFLKEAEKIIHLTGDKREEEVDKLAKYFMETVSTFGSADIRRRFRTTPRSGTNAMFCYLFTKFLYVLNIYAQVVLLNHFLGESYLHWGYQTAWNLLNGIQTQESTVFPRVIMCDFQIRRLGNIQNHSVQCVIMMNLINEKLYFVLYFWFLFLAVLNMTNFLYYVCMMLVPRMRLRSVMYKVNYIKTAKDQEDLERFVSECLHPDGVLLLQFLTEHVGSRTTYDLATKLHDSYSAQRKSVESFSDDSMKHSPLPMKYSQPPTYHQGYYNPDSSAPLQEYMEQGTLRLGEKGQCSSSSRSSPTDV